MPPTYIVRDPNSQIEGIIFKYTKVYQFLLIIRSDWALVFGGAIVEV